MRKLFTILLVLVNASICFGQPIVRRSNSSITVQDDNLWAKLSLFAPHFTDTSQANLAHSLDSAGKIIWTNVPANVMWQRNSNPKKWVRLGANFANADLIFDASHFQNLNGNLLRIYDGNSEFNFRKDQFDSYLEKIVSGTRMRSEILQYISTGDIVASNANMTVKYGNMDQNQAYVAAHASDSGTSVNIGVVNGVIGLQGLQERSSVSDYMLVIDTSVGHTIAYRPIPSGGTQTWQQTLTTGSVLTQDNSISGAYTLNFGTSGSRLVGFNAWASGNININATNINTFQAGNLAYVTAPNLILEGTTSFQFAGAITTIVDTTSNKPLTIDVSGNVHKGYWFSGGTGTGINNTNVGSAYRLLEPAAQGIKTLSQGFGILIDSITAHQIKITLDTANLPFYDFPVRPQFSVIDGGSDVDTLCLAGLEDGVWGTVGQSIRVNAARNGWEWYTPTGGSISGLTAGRVPVAASSTTLTDFSTLTFASSILTVTGTTRISTRLRVGNQDAFPAVDVELNMAGTGEHMYIITNDAGATSGIYTGNSGLSESLRFEYYPSGAGGGGVQTPSSGALFTVGVAMAVGAYTANALNFYTNNTLRGSFSSAGIFTLSTTPTTSAGTYDVLTRNTSTGAVEKLSSATFIKQGSNTLSSDLVLGGSSGTYQFTANSLLAWTLSSTVGNGGLAGVDITVAASGTLALSGGTYTLSGVPSSSADKILVWNSSNNQVGYRTTADVQGTLFTQTSTQTIAATTTPTTIFGSGVGSNTIAASTATVGKQWRLKIRGVYSTPALSVGNVTFDIKLGSVIIGTGTANSLVAASTNLGFEAECIVTCRTIGASGTVMTTGSLKYDAGTSNVAQLNISFNNGAATSTIDFTASNAFDCVITWSNNTAGNSISSLNYSLEALN